MQNVAGAGLVPTSASTLPPFALLQPTTVAEAAAALREHEGAVALAGGTDLVAAFNEGLCPRLLVDLSRVAALRRIEVVDGAAGAALRIGAAVTHAAGCADARVAAHAPGFAAAWRRIANPRVRLTGTLGGNLMARRVRYEGSLLLSAIGARLHFAGGAVAEPSALWRQQGAVPGRALLEAIEVPLQDLVWFGYERSLRPLLTVACAVRRAAAGLRLRAALATEYLAPVVLEGPLPAGRPARREAVRTLLAGLPESFADPVLNARYARSAGAVLVERQLEEAHLG